MTLLFFTHLMNGLLMVAMPIALGAFLTRRFKLGWRLWWIGVGTFVFSQVGHIPFNSILTVLFERGVLPAPSPAWKLPFNAVVLGLSAGLWEELSRYAAYRWWARDARSWRKGILLGAGHGGVEAIVLGILVLVNFVYLAAIQPADLAARVPASQLALAQQQYSAYWSAPWYATLLGAVERAFTIPVQIAFSVVVLQAFTRRQKRWIWLAVGWHALIDAAAVYASSALGLYLTELVLGMHALLAIAVIFALRQPEPEPALEEELPPVEMLSPEILTPVDETPVNLEKTRYN